MGEQKDITMYSSNNNKQQKNVYMNEEELIFEDEDVNKI